MFTVLSLNHRSLHSDSQRFFWIQKRWMTLLRQLGHFSSSYLSLSSVTQVILSDHSWYSVPSVSRVVLTVPHPKNTWARLHSECQDRQLSWSQAHFRMILSPINMSFFQNRFGVFIKSPWSLPQQRLGRLSISSLACLVSPHWLLFLTLKKYLFLLYLCMTILVAYICALHALGACGNQKSIGSQRTGVTVVSLHAGPGKWTQVCCKSIKCV